MRSVLKLGVVIVSLSFQTTAGFILRAPLLNPASPSLGQTAIAPPVAPLATAAITTAASPFTSPSVVSRQSVVRSSTLERPAASSPSASPSSVSNAQAAPLPTSERFIVLVEKPLGLVIEELDPSRPSQAGARIKSVRVDGCAAEAGVRAGDLLLAIDGETVAGRPFGEVIECMKSTGSGTADLELLRLPIGAYTDLEAADAAAASLRSVQFPLQSSYSSSSSPSFSRSESSSLSPLSSLSSSTAAPAVSFSNNSPMSQALPFLECPPLLRPSANAPDYVGNCGLDPLRLSKDRHSLAFYREAEIKHARLAMMAAAGWPVAELWDRQIAALFGLPNVLDANDGLNPALLNGGLFEVRRWELLASFFLFFRRLGDLCIPCDGVLLFLTMQEAIEREVAISSRRTD